MGRPLNPDLTKPWKLPLPATLVGRVEYLLSDPIHQKPLYGARVKLVEALLEYWIARETGRELPAIPSLQQLREMSNAGS